MKNNFQKLEDIVKLDPYEMIDVLTSEYLTDVPMVITTLEDMNIASQKLLFLSAGYSYITSLQSYMKVLTRQIKRTASKEEYEDMVDKKEIVQNIADAIKQQYNAISRAVTIKIENNKELNMSS